MKKQLSSSVASRRFAKLHHQFSLASFNTKACLVAKPKIYWQQNGARQGQVACREIGAVRILFDDEKKRPLKSRLQRVVEAPQKSAAVREI